jgi:hypothetical protein
MAQDRQIQISASILEELVNCLDAQSAVDRPDGDAQRALNARTSRVLSAAVTLLRGAQQPGSYSGTEIGQYHVDPSSSQFL